MRRAEELGRSSFQFQQWKIVSDFDQSKCVFTKNTIRYTQCEMMSVHYKHPVLLIEFEEDKSFTLDVGLSACHHIYLHQGRSSACS